MRHILGLQKDVLGGERQGALAEMTHLANVLFY